MIFQSALIIFYVLFLFCFALFVFGRGERMVYLICLYISVQQCNFLEIKNHYGSKHTRSPRFMRH